MADKISEDMFIAAQFKDCGPEVLQTPVKVFIVHMGTLEIMMHGSKQNLANVKGKKYVHLGQQEESTFKYLQ